MKNDIFRQVNDAALPCIIAILGRLNVQHRAAGHEIQMLNPMRADKRYGSFSINRRTGRWAEFATGDKGGDLISLAAYLTGQRQIDAAKELAAMLGVTLDD